MSSQEDVGQRSSSSSRLFQGLSWPLWACIFGTLFLRSASFATGALLGLVIGQFERQGLAGSGVGHGLGVGLLGAAYFAIEVAGAPAFGVLIDRRGFRTFLILGPLAGLISVLLEGLSATSALAVAEGQLVLPILAVPGSVALVMPLLFLARSFHGLSAAVSIPATLAFLSAETGDDAVRRSRAMAFFEVATIVGIGAGVSIAGRLWDSLGGWAFGAVAGLYVVSLIAFASSGRERASGTRERVEDFQIDLGPAAVAPRRETAGAAHGHLSLREILQFVTRPQVLRFVPSWIAVNAVVGLWIFYLPLILTVPDNPRQLLVGGFDGQMVSNVYIGVGLAFLVGIVGWGYLLGRWSPTSAMQIGLGGLYALVVVLFALNHATGQPTTILVVLVAAGLLALTVAAAFTPAALTYLAVLAEERAERRGATMGLYSVFLGVGQGIGILLAGPFYYSVGADGLIGLTFVLAIAATVGVQLLRAWERAAETSRDLTQGARTN